MAKWGLGGISVFTPQREGEVGEGGGGRGKERRGGRGGKGAVVEVWADVGSERFVGRGKADFEGRGGEFGEGGGVVDAVIGEGGGTARGDWVLEGGRGCGLGDAGGLGGGHWEKRGCSENHPVNCGSGGRCGRGGGGGGGGRRVGICVGRVCRGEQGGGG